MAAGPGQRLPGQEPGPGGWTPSVGPTAARPWPSKVMTLVVVGVYYVFGGGVWVSGIWFWCVGIGGVCGYQKVLESASSYPRFELVPPVG